MSSPSHLNGFEHEIVLWRGKPNVLIALADTVLAGVIGAAISVIVTVAIGYLFLYMTGYFPVEDFDENLFLYLYASAGSGVLVVLAITSYRVLRNEYVVTREHIYVKKGKKLTAYPLRRVRKIELKKQFPKWFPFAVFLDICLDIVIPEEKEIATWAWSEKSYDHVIFYYLEDPEMIKEVIEQGIKAVRA